MGCCLSQSAGSTIVNEPRQVIIPPQKFIFKAQDVCPKQKIDPKPITITTQPIKNKKPKKSQKLMKKYQKVLKLAKKLFNEGNSLFKKRQFSRADKLLKKANIIFELCLKLLKDIGQLGITLLEEIENLSKDLKEKYSENLNLTGINLYKIDFSYCETRLEYQKKALDMCPHRIPKLLGMENENEKLDNIDSIMEEIKKTTKTNLDYSYLGITAKEMLTFITPSFLMNYINITKITKLDLSYNKIGDAGALELSVALKKMTSLQVIDLSGNKIGTVGMQCLWQSLRQCSVVKLAANNLTKDSAQYIAALVEHNLNITVLHLHLNPLAGGLTIIFKSLKTALNITLIYYQDILVAIKIEFIMEYEEIKLEIIQDFTYLLEQTEVKLDNICFGANQLDLSKTTTFYAALRKNKIVQKLALYKNKLNPESLATSIQYHSSLQTLDIADTQITSSGMLLIAKSVITTKITTLRCGLNRIGSDYEGIQAIKILLKSTEIETLEINQIGLGDEGLIDIIDELETTKIKKIDISSNKITNAGGRHLLKIKDKTIIANDNDFKDRSIIKHIESLNQSEEIIKLKGLLRLFALLEQIES